jgi:hypothetical protein
VTLRPKRVDGQRVTVAVAKVLERDLAVGFGLIDNQGTTYRYFYYDIVPSRKN